MSDDKKKHRIPSKKNVIQQDLLNVVSDNHSSFISGTHLGGVGHGGVHEKHFDLKKHEQKIKENQKLKLSRDETLDLLYELASFPLGIHLLLNQCFDPFWFSYVTRMASHEDIQTDLEKWFVFDCPFVQAVRERQYHVNRLLEASLKSNSTIAAIPCGLMDDLVYHDYFAVENVHIIAVDQNKRALKYTEQQANDLLCGRSLSFEFVNKDPLALDMNETLSVILNQNLLYENESPVTVRYMYQEFYKMLEIGGRLIISFLTPPPEQSVKSSWAVNSPLQIHKQKAIFEDIIDMQEPFYRTEDQIREDLLLSGFIVDDLVYDEQGMCPTIVAAKLC